MSLNEEMLSIVSDIHQSLDLQFGKGWVQSGSIIEVDLERDRWRLEHDLGLGLDLVASLYRVRIRLPQFTCSTQVYVAFPKPEPRVLDYYHEDHTLSHRMRPEYIGREH